MEYLLLITQIAFALMVAVGVYTALKAILSHARWDLCQVDPQAFAGVPLPARRLLGLLMRVVPLIARFARPSLSVKRDLDALGLHPKFDDLLFSRLRASLVLLATVFSIGLIALAVGLGLEPLVRWLAIALPTALLLAWVLPAAWLRDQAKAARRSILRGFPAFLDVLALVLESGQNFQSALQLSVQRLSGAGSEAVLKRQLQELTQDIRAGQSKAVALQRFADRLGLPEVTQFTASIRAADQQGVSVTALLRRQAAQLRSSRALAAERQAMKLPVKLLMPLAVCIFPCTFLILAFPLAVRLSSSGLF